MYYFCANIDVMNKMVSKIATRLVVTIVAGLSAFTFGGCNFSIKGTSAEQNDTVRVCENIAYGSKERNFFDLYIPAGADKKRSMLLFFSFMVARGHRVTSLPWPMIAVSLPSVVMLLLP